LAQPENSKQRVKTLALSTRAAITKIQCVGKHLIAILIGAGWRAPVRLAVEAALRHGWERFIGHSGLFVGMTGFGASAPAERLFQEFGITVDAVVSAIQAATA
jgi:transketolase